MATIETSIRLKDGVSPALQSMNRALNIVLNTLQSVSAGFQRPIDVAAFNTARNELARAAVHIENLETGTNDAVVAQQRLVQAANNVANAESAVTNEIKEANTQQQKFNADNKSIVSVVERMDAGFQSVVTELKNITYYVSGIVPGLQRIGKGVNDIKNGQTQTVNAIRSGNAELQKTATSIYRANINQLRLTSSFKQGVLSQLKLKGVTQQIKPAIDQNGRAQQKFNDYVRSGVYESTRFLSNIRTALGAYLGFNSVKGVINTADTLVTTAARLDLINDGLQTTKQLQQKIYESAMNSRAGYAETADIVAKLATRAGKVFGSNDETVAFANTLQKMFHIAGASTQEMNSASLQLVQALGSGVLRGEELNAVFEAAPNVIQAIADYLNQPIGKIREMAKKGEITAGIVKNAMFAAADDVNKKFASLPMTWGQAWTIIKNFTLKTFEPLLQRISAITSSDRFKGFAEGLGRAIAKVAKAITWIFDKVSGMVAYIHDNWSKLKPIILGIAVGMLAFNTALTITKISLAAYNLVLGVMEAKQKLAAGATFLQTSQQVGLNMAMLACPWVWLVGGIIALVAIIGTVIACTYDWENSNIDLKQTIFNVMQAIKNIAAKTVEFLKNAWLNVWGKIKQLALEVWGVFKAIGQFVINNWSLIAPIVWGIVGAFVAYKLALLGIAAWHVICAGAVLLWNGVVAVAKFIMSLFTLATWKQVAANIAMTVSSWAATSPLLFWIVVIAAIIALFYIVIACINKWCGTTISATGIICGYFTALYAHIYNIFSYIWNIIAAVVEFFVNVWTEPMYSVKKLFVNLATNVLDMFIAMTQGCDEFATAFVNAILWAINKVLDGWNWLVDKLGIVGEKMGLGKAEKFEARASITSDLKGFKSDLESLVADKPAGYWEAPKMEKKSIGDYYMKGYDWGANLGDKLSSGASDLWGKGKDKLGGLLEDISGFDMNELIATQDPSDVGNATDDPAGDLGKALSGGYDNPALDKIAGNTDDIAKNTGATADNTASSDEDFKYMRRLAEREAMNRYQLTDLKVEMTNNNSISSNVDADKVMLGLVKQITHAAKTNAESAFSFAF